MFFTKNFLKIRKVKKYLENIEETLGDLRDYQILLDISSSISNHIKKDESLRKAVYGAKDPRSPELLKLLEESNLELKKEFLKIPSTVKGDDWQTFKSHIKAEVSRPNKSKIENIAFAGGGAKGMAYPGAIRAFSEHDLQIKSVSGTSAGAITALPFALGYTPRKIETIVYNYDFTNFIYESNLNRNPFLNKLLGLINPENEALMHRSVYLDTFKNNVKKPFFKYMIYSGKLKEVGIDIDREDVRRDGLKETMARIKVALETNEINLDTRRRLYKEIDEPLKKIIKRSQDKAHKAFIKSVKDSTPKIKKEDIREMLSQGFKSERDAVKTFLRMYRKEDVIEEFFGDLIENKLMTLGKKKLEAVEKGLSKAENLRNIDFVQFKKLVDAYPESHLKHLAVCVCEKKSDNPLKLLSKDNYEQIDVSAEHPDASIRQMPLKVAIRMSMNLPGAFSSYEYKGKKYVDGGVRANFPLHYFDKVLGVLRSKTLGLCLAPVDTLRRTSNVNNLGTPEERAVLAETNVIKSFFTRIGNTFSRGVAYFRGNKLDNNAPFDSLDLIRVGVINVMDVSTTEFGLNKEEKLALFKQGYETASDMMEPNYNAQLRHYRERAKALYEYVEKALKELPKEKVEDEIISSNYSNYAEIKEKMKEWSSEPKKEYNIKGRVSKIFRR